MVHPDRNAGAANQIIRLLRKITRIVQIVPFVYLCFYSLYMIGSTFLPDGILCIADSLMVSSPLATGGMLVASRLLKLCRWHKAACLIPSTSQVEGYVDSFIIQFTQNEIILINSLIGIAAGLFAMAAYRHFFSNGR